MAYPADRRYTKDHEWLQLDGQTAAVGVTDFAQKQLGDVVFVELPEVGRTVTMGEAFGSIESVKAVSDLFAPMSGVVQEVNSLLASHPEVVNSDPHGAWMIRIQLSQPSETAHLLEAAQYEALLG